MRNETRKQRYLAKQKTARYMDVEVATINIMSDENIAYVARSVACFGAKRLHVIGKQPNYATLKAHSGGHAEFINFMYHRQPTDLIQHARENNLYMVSAELDDRAEDFYKFIPPKNQTVLYIVGHESLGVPEEILHRSDKIIYIPMPGIGFCLNTSQAANIILAHHAMQTLGTYYA